MDADKYIEQGMMLAEMLGSIVNEKEVNTQGAAWNLLYNIAQKNNVSAMLCNYVPKTCPENIRYKFLNDYKKSLILVTKLDYIFDRVCDSFKKENIEFLPLKGKILRNIYPQPYMRTSCDTDIYIRENDRESAKKCLYSLDFSLNSCGDGVDVYFKEPVYCFEIHFMPFDGRLKNCGCFGDLLERAEYDSACGYYRFNDNDLYLYNFLHLYKHFDYAGCGIKLFLDLYILSKRLDLNFYCINSVVENCGLTEFHETVLNLNKIFFEGESPKEKYKTLTAYILANGNFGNGAHAFSEEIKSDKSKHKFVFFLKQWFLSTEQMKPLYPILEKAPFLLPFCWIHKGVRTLFRNPSAIKREIKKVKFYSKDYCDKFDYIKSLAGIKEE